MVQPATPACSPRKPRVSGATNTWTVPCWWRRWNERRPLSSSDPMRRPQQVIVEQARMVAAELPPPLVETLAEAIERAGPGWMEAQGAILTNLSHPHYRFLAGELMRVWG